MQVTMKRTAYHSLLLVIGLLSPLLAGPTFKSFRIPTDNSQPRHIVLGSDGNMWFTESEFNVSQIGRIDPQGHITEFPVPTQFSQPSDIAAGADGALWFTAPSGFPDFFIGRVTTSGHFTGFAPECDLQFGCSISPNGIAATADGNIWFTEFTRNVIGKLEPASGNFTFYDIPTPDAVPAGITVGPDGALWFAEFHGNQIGRIDPATGTITEFGATAGADRITTGPDGNLWFTMPFNSRIGRITTAGVIMEFSLPTPSQPRDIVAGPNGNLWFTEFSADRVSQITPDGVVTEVKRVKGSPWGIGVGIDNTIWFTLFDGNKIARLRVSP